MPKGPSLCLWKLVSGIPIQACCLYTSYLLVRDSIYRNDDKRMVERFTIPHCYWPCVLYVNRMDFHQIVASREFHR